MPVLLHREIATLQGNGLCAGREEASLRACAHPQRVCCAAVVVAAVVALACRHAGTPRQSCMSRDCIDDMPGRSVAITGTTQVLLAAVVS
jgi:hypothetical protein